MLSNRCPDCGFDPASTGHTEVADRIATDATEWVDRLTRAGVRDRPAPGVWSILEYGCHVRDVHRIFDQRVRLMLSEDEPRFPNWDQDATALADDYPSQDPAVVARELFEAATTVADTYRSVPDDAWSRCGYNRDWWLMSVSVVRSGRISASWVNDASNSPSSVCTVPRT